MYWYKVCILNSPGTSTCVLATGMFNVCMYRLRAGEDGLGLLHPPAPVLQGNPRRVRYHPGGLLVRARGAPLPYPDEGGQEGRQWKVC